MTTDITELALIAKIEKQLENFDTVILKEAEANALVEALEKAQTERDEIQQGFIANQEEAHEAIKYATELKEQLARACAGREEAFREVDEMQKSLDHTHKRRAIWREKAVTAETEIATLRQRIAELESRTVTVHQSDYFASLVAMARISADKAMRKFPQPNYVLLKVAEEAGEVVQAGVHYAESRMEWKQVEGEIVQLLAMLIRLVTEGDEVNGVKPPASFAAGIKWEGE